MADPFKNIGSILKSGRRLSPEEQVAAERRYDELRMALTTEQQLASEAAQPPIQPFIEAGPASKTSRRPGAPSSPPRERPEGIAALFADQQAAQSAMPNYGPRVTDSKEFQKTFQGDGVTPPPPPTHRDAAGINPFPQNINDWSTYDHLRIMWTPDGQRIYEDARKRAQPPSDEREQFGPTLPEGWTPPADAAPAPEANPMQPVQPTGGDTGQTVQPVMTDRQAMIEEIKRQREMVDAIYPQRSFENPAQVEADKYAEAERERANALAQLAFFSGITQSSGGQWEGVGRGLAAAGQAHAQGFERYQRALQAKAGRATDMNEQRYQDDASRANAAVKLYEGEQDTRRELEKQTKLESRERQKDRREAIDKYFGKRLDLAKGNDFTPTDQGLVDRYMKDWRISLDRGEIIDTQDVRDKKKPDPNAPSS